MRTCATCGQSIIWKNSQARYCSTRCRVAAHRAGIPPELAHRNRWIRWRTEHRNGKPTKAPIQINGDYASSTDPATCTDHATAKASTIGDGLGFVLGDGIGCIDLDHCLINGKPTAEALRFLEQYPNHYIEISPSGDGLHIWGYLDEAPGTKRVINGLSVETYSTGRYITITGRPYQRGQLLPL